MFGGKFNHEARFFADGYELSGVDNATFSYNNAANILKPLGTKDGLTTHSGPTQQTLSVSRVLTYNDPIFSYTGDSPISGSIFYENNYYGFETGYLVDYSLNCAVGAVPRVSCNFQVASQMKSGVNANLAPQSHPEIDIPTQGSISITCDNSTTNRVVGFDYGVKCERKAYLTIGSNDIVKVELLPPLQYNATVQLDVDDAFLQDAYKFLDDKENKTLSLNVNGRSGSLIQSIDIPNASLVGEDLQVSADGSTKITLKYIGHSSAYEATTLSGDVTYLFDENGAIYDQTGSAQLPVSWYNEDLNIYGIQLGNNVTKVGEIGFRDCPNLGGDLYIDMDSGSGPTVSSIGFNAFTNCTGFNGNLIIEEGLERIEYAAFKNTSFNGDLILPDSLAQISGEAFKDCKNFDGILKLPTEKFGMAYDCFKGCVGFRGDLIIPDKIEKLVPYGAFQACQFDGNIYLGTGIEIIDEFAFFDCNKLKGDLTMPPNLIEVKEAAFNGCSELDGKLTLNPSLEKIGNTSFARCSQLSENLDIPDSVTGIGDYAFHYCSGIEGLTIGDNLEYIGDFAFKFCDSLAGEIDFKDVKSIGRSAFENNDNIKSVKFDSIESIGVFAFRDCDGLNGDLFLPDTLTSLQDRAFALCRNLDGNLTISNSLTEIPYRAFTNCGFSGDLNMGNNVGWVHQEAFKACGFTNQLILPDTLSGISYRGFYGGAFTGDLLLKDNIKQIYGQAFRKTRNIKRVIVDFPETVFKDGNHFLECGADVGGACLYANARDYDGYVARSVNGLFGGIPICRGAIQSRVYRASDDFILKDEDADIPQTWYNIDDSNADGNPEVYIDIGSGASIIGEYAFGSNTYIKGDISIPSNVKKISNGAFQGASEIDGNLYLNEGLEYIEEFAFRYCDKIKGDLVLPDSLTGIERQAFLDCSGLDGTLTIGRGLREFAGYDQFGVRQAANYLFEDCKNLRGELYIPSNIISGSIGTFSRCSGFDSLIFEGDNIKLLGNRMFRFCSGISNPIRIPDSVTYVGSDCFRGCVNIPSVELGGSVQTIGGNAFRGCVGLDSITLRDNITTVNSNAFLYCSGIQYAYVDVPETAVAVGALQFQSEATSDKILFVSEDYYADYVTAGLDGYYQGNLLSVWPEDQRITTYYDQNFVSLDSVNGDVEDAWKQNDPNGYYLYIGSNTSRIGVNAFNQSSSPGVSNLSGTLLLPSTLRSIGNDAFVRTKITNIASQEGLEVIESNAFAICTNLESVKLPSTLTSIGYRAFRSPSMKDVTIGSNNATSRKTIIGTEAFYPIEGSNTKNGVVNLGYSVDQVGDRAFADNFDDPNYRWIKTLNCSARYIGYQAFKWQRNLSNLNLTDSVSHLRDRCFQFCSSLTSVVIPDPDIVELYAFEDCTGITGISIGNDEKNTQGRIDNDAFRRVGPINPASANGKVYIGSSISYVGSYAFTADNDTTFRYRWIKDLEINSREIAKETFWRQRFITGIKFGDSVKVIGVAGDENSRTFYDNYELKEIKIPDPEDIYGRAFQYCTGTTGVYIGNNERNAQGTIHNQAFRNVGTNTTNGHLYVGSSIASVGYESFRADATWKWIQSADLNCQSIGHAAFGEHSNMTDLTFGSGVKSIGVGNGGVLAQSFYRCYGLTGVRIPDPTDIWYYSFDQCNSITGVYIGNDTENTQGVIHTNAFRVVGSTAQGLAGNGHLYVGSSIDLIGELAFYGDQDWISSANINCREIGHRALESQDNMTSLTLGDNVKTIRNRAFDNCDGITSLVIPNPDLIDGGAFIYCRNLSYVEIGGSVPGAERTGVIETNAFNTDAGANVTNAVVKVENKIRTIKSDAFNNNRDWIKYATLASYDIGTRSFANQANLIDVYIRDSNRFVRLRAFENCTSLRDLRIGKYTRQVGDNAFVNCGITGDIKFKAGNTAGSSTLKIYNDAFGGTNNKPRNVYLNGDYWDGVSTASSDSFVDFRNITWPVNMSGAFYVTGDGWTIGESAGPHGKPVRQWTTYPTSV